MDIAKHRQRQKKQEPNTEAVVASWKDQCSRWEQYSHEIRRQAISDARYFRIAYLVGFVTAMQIGLALGWLLRTVTYAPNGG